MLEARAQIAEPTDIPDLVFWVDATDVNGTGVQPLNGDSVSTWVDKSSSGNNLTTDLGTVTFQETGFDGTNPGLRFPSSARMRGGNPFSSSSVSEFTIFFVNANNNFTNNFSVSLNGTSNSSNNRVSFHTPWSSTMDIYFDAATSGGANRLREDYTYGDTETLVYTGLNDVGESVQELRVDGVSLASDTSGHMVNVNGGVRLGRRTSGQHAFNGRFGEVIVYDRGLTSDEVQDVECYLLHKWKPAAAPSFCFPELSTSKTATAWPTGEPDMYIVPGEDVLYTISVTHDSGPALDSDSIFLADRIPDEVTFYNGDIDDDGPETDAVQFTESSSGLSWTYGTNVGFSSAATRPSTLADCNYTPSAGYDALITYVCINPSGSFGSITSGASFSVSFRARIN